MKKLNTYNLSRKVAKGEDDEDEFFPQKLGYSYTQEVRTQATVHLNQPFMAPGYYDNVVDALDRAQEGDVFRFIIASPGGRMDGLLSLLDAVERTEAICIASIVGDCSSAASIFALSCHQVTVGRYAEMLVHSARYGTIGKSSDVLSHVLHTTKVTERVMRDAYAGFLSEQEINEVLNGKELYLDSDEIVERLEAREEYFESKANEESCSCSDPECSYGYLPEQEDFQQQEFFEEVKPKKKKKSKKE